MLLPMIEDGLLVSFHLQVTLVWSELEVNPSYDDDKLDKTFSSNYPHCPDLIFSFTSFSSPFRRQCSLRNGYHGKEGEAEWPQKTASLSLLVRRLGFLLRSMCNPSIGPW